MNGKTLADIRDAIRGELEAINDYERFAGQSDDKHVRQLFRHIADEERHHVAELMHALMSGDPDQAAAMRDVMAGMTDHKMGSRADDPGSPVLAATHRSLNTASEKIFSAQELAAYNGQGGRPAYVAIEGAVYDVTDLPTWAGGLHSGLTAGRDLTGEFGQCHDPSLKRRLPKVGTLTAAY